MEALFPPFPEGTERRAPVPHSIFSQVGDCLTEQRCFCAFSLCDASLSQLMNFVQCKSVQDVFEQSCRHIFHNNITQTAGCPLLQGWTSSLVIPTLTAEPRVVPAEMNRMPLEKQSFFLSTNREMCGWTIPSLRSLVHILLRLCHCS